MTITKETTLIVSFAAKQNSLGAAMHNAGYAAIGVNAAYTPITTFQMELFTGEEAPFEVMGKALLEAVK
ncbi:MAG: hypothetical protein JWN01_765 [Patescibacteria group bacterium]|nr:hypothetical protein [Patescibacteria group bacterium]